MGEGIGGGEVGRRRRRRRGGRARAFIVDTHKNIKVTLTSPALVPRTCQCRLPSRTVSEWTNPPPSCTPQWHDTCTIHIYTGKMEGVSYIAWFTIVVASFSGHHCHFLFVWEFGNETTTAAQVLFRLDRVKLIQSVVALSYPLPHCSP